MMDTPDEDAYEFSLDEMQRLVTQFLRRFRPVPYPVRRLSGRDGRTNLYIPRANLNYAAAGASNNAPAAAPIVAEPSRNEPEVPAIEPTASSGFMRLLRRVRLHNRTVFLRNLHYDATQEEVDAAVGCPVNIRRMRCGRSRGLGYIFFHTQEEATEKYLEMRSNPINIRGRNVYVHWPRVIPRMTRTVLAPRRVNPPAPPQQAFQTPPAQVNSENRIHSASQTQSPPILQHVQRPSLASVVNPIVSTTSAVDNENVSAPSASTVPILAEAMETAEIPAAPAHSSASMEDEEHLCHPCLICSVVESTYAFNDCGHFGLCESCLKRTIDMRNLSHRNRVTCDGCSGCRCPVCRLQYISILRIYS